MSFSFIGCLRHQPLTSRMETNKAEPSIQVLSLKYHEGAKCGPSFHLYILNNVCLQSRCSCEGIEEVTVWGGVGPVLGRITGEYAGQ